MYAMSEVDERKGKNANNQSFFLMLVSDFLLFLVMMLLVHTTKENFEFDQINCRQFPLSIL